jgi:enoyl-[acyl-carrier protein] reductase I
VQASHNEEVATMVPIQLAGKTAVVTGVSDDVGFAWHISKALYAAGAQVVLASHPRLLGIVERFLTRERYAESRQLPFGVAGEFQAKALLACDVAFDTNADISDAQRGEKGYDGGDVSIDGCVTEVKKHTSTVDIVIHSVAFSPEISKSHADTSRAAYLTAMSVSSYSLVALARAFAPMMPKRDAGGGSVVGLSYIAAQRAVAFYGGGMASAKAALECDARMLAALMGDDGHRINIVSAGPYASRAAKSIGDIGTMIDTTAQKSPLRRPIEPDDVANAVLFLSSGLAKNITGETLYVDAGYHAMGA